jgi:lipopolysaccharide/colanic/teichoic acid biosynthesis glycosyltransferase
MSIVGPRPERRYYIEQIVKENPRYTELYKIRPGLTSYATIYNGYTDSMDKMLKRLDMDLYYLEHQSFWGDMKIIVETVKRMFVGENDIGFVSRK